MSSLFNQYISNTYTGVLHAGGTAIPSSGKVIIYDGAGNATDLELGRNNAGIKISGPAEITGTLTVGGTFTLNDSATITGTVSIGGNTTIDGFTTINGGASVTNNITVGGTIFGNNNLSIDGWGYIGEGFTVNGFSVFNDGFTANNFCQVKAHFTVEGQTKTNTLIVNDLHYPGSTGTVGHLMYRKTEDTLGFIDPDDIIISDDDDVITRTIYKNYGISDPILVDINSENDTWSSAVDLSNHVSDGTKAIIAYLDLPGSAFSGEDVSYIIYASRNGQNSTAVPIIRVANGSDGENDERYGGSTQFQSRISTNKTIRFRLDVEETQGGSISRSNWRLYIIAEQK